MSQMPGRNQPCRCGSGAKYKKCCLAKDEEVARAAARQSALLGDAIHPPHRHRHWDDDDPDLDDELDLDVGTITRICYTRGLVDRIADYRAGRGVRVAEWESSRIPERLREVIEEERLDLLDGRWGDPTAAEPMQVDVIDLETDVDLITIEVFNRERALFDEDDGEIRRISRVCAALEVLSREQTLPTLVVAAVPPDEDHERSDRSESG
jgi:hypothetical protein